VPLWLSSFFMVNLIIVGHSDFPSVLVKSAEEILGSIEKLKVVPLYPSESKNDLKAKLKEAIKELGFSDAILVLIDMFGGTPCNVALSFQKKYHLKIITGLNLPMLLEAVLHREEEIEKLTLIVKEAAKKSVVETW